jgi:hypothetical protein
MRYAVLLLLAVSGDLFVDVTDRAGVAGNRRAAWGDLDGDRRPDLVSWGIVYLNKGDGTFADATESLGLKGNPRGPALVADFDNDGRNDIYFGGGEGALYLNGPKGFRKGEAASNPHKKAEGLGAADIDNDGWLDLYVANHEVWQKENSVPFPDLILRNQRGRLVTHWTASGDQIRPARSAVFCDFNEDGKIDAYVSNYRLRANTLWVNQGGGRFADHASELGCAGHSAGKTQKIKDGHGRSYVAMGHTIGSAWTDFDNDGLFDLFVGNFSHPPAWQDRPQVLRNLGKTKGYRFEDMSARAGIPWQESYASPAAGDFDNDGLVDVYFTTVYKGDSSRLFRNGGGWRFEDVTGRAGVSTSVTYQAAWADFDDDGRLDLMAGGRLFRNVTRERRWLKVRLVGSHCNRSAVGAQVRIGTRVRQVECGTGSGNQNDLTLHFGLGDQTGPVAVSIRWPCGRTQEAESELDRTLEVVEKDR